MTPPIWHNRFCENIRAVTLIEILVCAGIIAILAAMLFPSIKSLGAKARENKCLTNHRSIIQAVLTYTADHGGSLPGNIISGGPDDEAGRFTADKVSSYRDVKWENNKRWASQWNCPFLEKKDIMFPFSGYAFSIEVFGSGPNKVTPTKMSAINSPSKTAAFSCTIGNYILYADYAFPNTTDPLEVDFSKGQISARHRGRAIISFMDGHTQLVEPYPKTDPRFYWFSLNSPKAP